MLTLEDFKSQVQNLEGFGCVFCEQFKLTEGYESDYFMAVSNTESIECHYNDPWVIEYAGQGAELWKLWYKKGNTITGQSLDSVWTKYLAKMADYIGV